MATVPTEEKKTQQETRPGSVQLDRELLTVGNVRKKKKKITEEFSLKDKSCFSLIKANVM